MPRAPVACTIKCAKNHPNPDRSLEKCSRRVATIMSVVLVIMQMYLTNTNSRTNRLRLAPDRQRRLWVRACRLRSH